MGLCDECKKAMRQKGYVITPADHCHHDEDKDKPKEKCWCEYDSFHRPALLPTDYKEKYEQWWRIKYCPVCGRKLED